MLIISPFADIQCNSYTPFLFHFSLSFSCLKTVLGHKYKQRKATVLFNDKRRSATERKAKRFVKRLVTRHPRGSTIFEPVYTRCAPQESRFHVGMLTFEAPALHCPLRRSDRRRCLLFVADRRANNRQRRCLAVNNSRNNCLIVTRRAFQC